MDACIKSGYTYYGTWEDLEVAEQSRIIAKYLLDGYISSHQQDAQAKEARRGKKKKKNG
jgi:hypothetical protein